MSKAGKLAEVGGSISSGPNAVEGLAKAWYEYTTNTSTALTKTFNIASATDNGTGDTSLTFTSNMDGTSYAATLGPASYNTSGNTSYSMFIKTDQTSKSKTASTFTVIYAQISSSGFLDHGEFMGAINGDLA